MQDHDYNMDVSRHYKAILRSLTVTAVVRDQMQAVEFLGSHLRPLMTAEEVESFRSVLKSARAVAKQDAERAEQVIADNLRREMQQAEAPKPVQGDMFGNGDGGAKVTNPVPPTPPKPNDGEAMALPIPTVSIKQAKASLKASQRLW
jgi:hypothetical protein